jgi:hypothetical protein
MSKKSIDALNKKLFDKAESSDVECIVDMARELGCISDVIGRTYEVYDKYGELLYRVKQKPMKINQLNILLKTVESLRKREEKEMNKGIKKR